ncbi:hypothetical protein E6P09_05425 [Haloferax mediterranei ATCC 33500]|uniref:SRPBCC family protein n=1 Tax=Haloferax mediterranei (strain ATCC 33500 / DSM 1411 / JCM 8866 / NBRC 14739 / NCIMB 2177 / R-4) TaxID=523841 RepID=I3R1U7_HALMT|nr:hypothetical protein [Haloferax mediterranei]AFK18207.1 hypothetical protein HFX_0474 [Haloferax mediterranei ATCC 33500]AHZ22390.1 hypothetical protein BM92_06890 [Haloferax mediterranei ATCC 33500]EMA02520.1 hypothetical protein C439_08055 [Haloferax mediterranei ATCC 33500]MDX5988296.1 hypothetical protein [Haloferax mediterranei ATCC 33500]QCQ74732.1 hypothetical protein E6P09_05425 [Haloferax mediterranei ATCC 33500]
MGTRRIIRALGLAGLGIASTYYLAIRPWHRRWGTTNDEAAGPLPGDDFVSDYDTSSTRAITIGAPARAVWPWLVQLGQGRGGFYSYERLENLFGLGIDNADRILSEYQHLDVGDEVRLGPPGANAPSFHVALVDPGRSLTLSAPGWETGESPAVWTFALHEVTPNTTRLIVRFRGRSETLRERVVNRLIIEPVQFAMERKMLKGVRERAERTRASATEGRRR